MLTLLAGAGCGAADGRPADREKMPSPPPFGKQPAASPVDTHTAMPLAPASSVRLSFDRGTLLVDGLDRARASALPGVLWDGRTQQYRAPAWRYRDLLGALRDLACPVDDRVSRAKRAALAAWKPPELRPYQQAALGAWHLADHRGLVVLPTGAGKTRLAIAAMHSVPSASVLCLVPTRVLLHQWIEQLSAWYAGPVGCWGDGRRQTEAITVATFESGLRRAADSGALFDLLIVDEAHHFGDRLRDEALEMCTAPMRLGLTATPPEQAAAQQRLAELIGPVQFELSIADLAGTYLSAYDLVVLRAPLSALELEEYQVEQAAFARVFRAFRLVSPRGAWTEFVATASRSDEGRRALAAWRRARQIQAFPEAKRTYVKRLLERHAQSRILLFTPDNASAYQLAREHFIMPLTCDISRKEREAVLHRFRKGELRALVSARVLNEGLDVPEADVAIIVGGSLGGREHVQRVGRLLRPAPGKRAAIYELVASTPSERWTSIRRRRALASRTSAAG